MRWRAADAAGEEDVVVGTVEVDEDEVEEEEAAGVRGVQTSLCVGQCER